MPAYGRDARRAHVIRKSLNDKSLERSPTQGPPCPGAGELRETCPKARERSKTCTPRTQGGDEAGKRERN